MRRFAAGFFGVVLVGAVGCTADGGGDSCAGLDCLASTSPSGAPAGAGTPAANDPADPSGGAAGTLPGAGAPGTPSGEPGAADPGAAGEPAGGTTPDPGSEPTTDPAGGTDPTGTEPTHLEDLDPAELEHIDRLRNAVEGGLTAGRAHYLERVSIVLQGHGITDDYEGDAADGTGGLDQEPEDCPFETYYDNGFEPNPVTCEFLVDQAKVDAYATVSKALETVPTNPNDDAELASEVAFWVEQGALSGMEQGRVVVRSDVRARGLCNTKPSPSEGAYEKGLLVGRKLFMATFNLWLGQNGYVADYPTMSHKITVCNADVSMLQPARKSAQKKWKTEAESKPLCGSDYQPPSNMESKLQYSQATLEYHDGIQAGVDDEFALAAVRVFQVVPCNVSDPLVVDLDGDGLELLPIHRGTNFDLFADGHPVAVAWVAPDDGFLALDRNGNGRIDDGSELFGNEDGQQADGFTQLALLDANGDGVIDARDPAYHRLVVWQDANSDGVSTPAELTRLADRGITAIPVVSTGSDLRLEGNTVPAVAHATTLGGPVLVGDAFLRHAPYARLAH